MKPVHSDPARSVAFTQTSPLKRTLQASRPFVVSPSGGYPLKRSL